jgi:glycosyltransferase involved in cell wall biosynthesis
MHALCVSEMEAIRSFGLNNPVCIIPNGVYLPFDPALGGEASARSATRTTEKTLLYLGRLHPKKNLESLLRAWASSLRDNSRVRDWTLSIVGWDHGRYLSHLRTVCQDLAIETKVKFLGPKYATEKDEVLKDADAFILPSLSEGLPMVVLEAWASGLPVLMTEQCNLPEGFTEDAAIRIGSKPESIADGIARLCSMTDEQRRNMGRNGLRLVSRRFSWPVVAGQMLSVYRWLTNQGPRPDIVF